MVLAGSINKQIVAAINAAGGLAVGLSGKDGDLIRRSKLRRTKRDPDSNIERVLDLGFVGEPSEINAARARRFYERSDIIPVIAPIGVGADGETYNINADTVAGAIAARGGRDAAADADRRRRACSTATGKLIPEMTVAEARRLHRRRHDQRRHDPEGRDLPRRGRDAASKAPSSSTAGCRTRCCWNCSPSTASARWSSRTSDPARGVRSLAARRKGARDDPGEHAMSPFGLPNR